MSGRRAILHIGVMKTGSKAIQSWIGGNRAFLGRKGMHVPESLGSNHSILGNLAVHLGDAEDVDDANRLMKLRTELDQLPASISTVLFSGETMSRTLRDAERVTKLKTVLDRYFSSYQIVVYLRRQDEQALSQYSSDMRRGLVRAELFSKTPQDYDTMLSAWAEVFGRDAIMPRLYEAQSLVKGDVVADFLAAIGLADAEVGEAPERPNSALTPPALQLLRELSTLGKQRGLFSDEFANAGGRKTLVQILDRHFSGRSARPARADAIAFFEHCRAANERVRAAWFPDRPTLFSEDFSRYPEVAEAPPDADAMLPVALTTILEFMATMPTRDRERTDKVWVKKRNAKRSAAGSATAPAKPARGHDSKPSEKKLQRRARRKAAAASGSG